MCACRPATALALLPGSAGQASSAVQILARTTRRAQLVSAHVLLIVAVHALGFARVGHPEPLARIALDAVRHRANYLGARMAAVLGTVRLLAARAPRMVNTGGDCSITQRFPQYRRLLNCTGRIPNEKAILYELGILEQKIQGPLVLGRPIPPY